jgi:hypothetical protein
MPNDPQQYSPIPGAGADYYITIDKVATEPGAWIALRWTTNLFKVDAGYIHIDNQTDDPDSGPFATDDEPEPIVTIDSHSGVDVALGSVHEGQDQGFDPWLRPIFVGASLDIHMYENDAAQGDCLTGPANCGNDLGHLQIGPVPYIPDTPAGDPTTQFQEIGGDGQYTLHYQAWRRIDDGGAPACPESSSSATTLACN